VEWVSQRSITLIDFNEAATVRQALDALALKLDGKAATATTTARKRAVFYSALRYGVELERLPSNPIYRVQWRIKKNNDAVDHQVVVNLAQVRRLLTSVRAIEPALEAFYACMYFAALRPGEALYLRSKDCSPPERWLGRDCPERVDAEGRARLGRRRPSRKASRTAPPTTFAVFQPAQSWWRLCAATSSASAPAGKIASS
jgi:integrase